MRTWPLVVIMVCRSELEPRVLTWPPFKIINYFKLISFLEKCPYDLDHAWDCMSIPIIHHPK